MAQRDNADTVLGRARELLSRGATTHAAFEGASAADVAARSAAAQAGLDLHRQQVGVVQADVHVTETQATSAQAVLDTARTAPEDTEVWTPVAGTVAGRRTRVGIAGR